MSGGNPVKRAEHRGWFDGKDVLGLVLLIGAAAGVFAPLFAHINSGGLASDYPYHAYLAEEIRRTHSLVVPHFLFHEVLIQVKRVQEKLTHTRPHTHRRVPPSLPDVFAQYAFAMTITCVLFTELLAIVVWAGLQWGLRAARAPGRWAIAPLLALTLLLVAPVAVLSNYYLGYIGINVWHNPTMFAVKPTALLSFWALLVAFSPNPAERSAHDGAAARLAFCAVLAALVMLSVIAKPNWIMCLIPAAGLVAVERDLAGRRVDWVLILLGMVTPAALVMLWQFHVAFGGGSAMEFAPLKVMRIYSDHLGFKLLLSILFPLSVYLVYFREARASLRLNLGWLAFLVGACFTYLVAEPRRISDGNFTWGAQIALYVLFFESMLLSLRVAAQSWSQGKGAITRIERGRLITVGLVYLMHLISGVCYYAHIMGVDVRKGGFFS